MNKAIAILTEGLALWRTYLERKKEIYEVSISKNKNKALNYAEKGFSIANELFTYTFNKLELSEEELDDVRKLNKDFKKIEKKFNKYD